MRCVIISESAGFPWGTASTSRVRSIAKALMHQGVDVQYWGLCGANSFSKTARNRSGIVDGIKFMYPGYFTLRSKNWYLRRLDDTLGKWLTFIKFHKTVKNEGIDCVIIYSRNYKTVMFWSAKFKKMGITALLELCEWPLANIPPGSINYKNALLFCNRAILQVDAILPISKYIEKKVENIVRENGKSIPMLKIPILTDFIISSEFKSKNKIYNFEKYILYCGSIRYMEIAYFVIDVMSELKLRGKKIKLKFTGNGDPILLHEIKEYTKKKCVEDFIDFTGFLDETDLLIYMLNSLCLLAPLPETEQSMARFPTKIGYYLSSGRPVVTNAVGSITEYLIDGENAYVAQRYDSKVFAEIVIEILNDYAKSELIGKNGQKLANTKFYYKYACKNLYNFINNISNVK